jgi:hypothetical protein
LNRYQGFAELGTTISTGGVTSTDKVRVVLPGSTVNVYLPGTTTSVSIYSDDGVTPKSNPFTASTDGSYLFYAANPAVDIKISGTGVASPFTVQLGGTGGTVPVTVNVMESPYNAVGDGSTDDTVAIQAAVNAVDWTVGGTITFPPGYTFKITAPITFPRVQQFGVYTNVSIEAYGANFLLASTASSGFYYHPSTQTINDNVIYNRIAFKGGQFKATSRTAGQTGIKLSSLEGARFQDIDFFNMNGINLRTAYRTIIENCNVNVSNEFGFKLQSGDWTGATSSNSPSNASVIRNCRVIPGSGSVANYWFINSDLSGVEGPSIHEGWDATLYPGSGNPQYEILFDNSGYTLGQTNWVRGFYSERPSLPSVAVIGAILNNGILALDMVRRYDDATGTVYVDATGSTADSTILLRAWPIIDLSPTPRFKTATGVQWVFDHVGPAASQNFQNSAWWVSGTVGAASQWGLNGIVVSGAGSSGGGVPAVQLGLYGLGAEASFGISRGPDYFILSSVSGDVILVARDRTKRILFGVGDGTDPTDKPAMAVYGNTTANGTKLQIYDITAASLRPITIGANDSGGTGYRVLRIPN